jgi:uncharacterized Zn finger protein
MNKKKIQKELNKKCPDCSGNLELVIKIKKDGYISYSTSYEECTECGYQKEIKNKHNHIDKYESEV